MAEHNREGVSGELGEGGEGWGFNGKLLFFFFSGFLGSWASVGFLSVELILSGLGVFFFFLDSGLR